MEEIVSISLDLLRFALHLNTWSILEKKVPWGTERTVQFLVSERNDLQLGSFDYNII